MKSLFFGSVGGGPAPSNGWQDIWGYNLFVLDTCRLLFIISTHKFVVSRNFLSIRIVWSSFYLLISGCYYGKVSGVGGWNVFRRFPPSQERLSEHSYRKKMKKKSFLMMSLLECKYSGYTCHLETVSYVLSPLIRPVEYNQKLPKISLLPVPLPHLVANSNLWKSMSC